MEATMEQILRDVPGVLRVSAVEPPEKYAGKVRLYSLRYQSDDCEVEGYAAFPLEEEGPWPGLIFNRGGNREFGSLRTAVLCRYALRGYGHRGTERGRRPGGSGTADGQMRGVRLRDLVRSGHRGALPHPRFFGKPVYQNSGDHRLRDVVCRLCAAGLLPAVHHFFPQQCYAGSRGERGSHVGGRYRTNFYPGTGGIPVGEPTGTGIYVLRLCHWLVCRCGVSGELFPLRALETQAFGGGGEQYVNMAECPLLN